MNQLAYDLLDGSSLLLQGIGTPSPTPFERPKIEGEVLPVEYIVGIAVAVLVIVVASIMVMRRRREEWRRRIEEEVEKAMKRSKHVRLMPEKM